MPLSLPRCAECGAAIRARTDENCTYCGAALPWEAWDELLRARVEVIPCSEATLDAVLQRIARSNEFVRAELENQRRRIRFRQQRPGKRHKPERPRVVDVLLGLAYPLGAVVVLSNQTFDPVVLGVLLLAALALVTLWWWFSRGSKLVARRRRRPANYSVGAFAVLGLAPTPRDSVRAGPGWRMVTLRSSEGEELRCFAETSLGLQPGACGIGWVQGVELERFECLEVLAEV